MRRLSVEVRAGFSAILLAVLVQSWFVRVAEAGAGEPLQQASAQSSAQLSQSAAQSSESLPLLERVQHHAIDSGGVEIHAVSLGEGPLVVMLHGFPDYWYTWRDVMPELARDHRVVAMDLRGYNRSGRPAGTASYAMPRLVEDVVAVIRHFGQSNATVVGHDWGGAIAWNLTMTRPEFVERLVILNLPHPNGLARELATNPKQQENSQYARNFQRDGAHEMLTAEGLASWVRDPQARAHYVEAFRRSDFEAMLHYYKANYPRVPASGATSSESSTASPAPSAAGASSDGSSAPSAPRLASARVAVPVLMIHGLEDQYLLHAALNGTWEWIDADLTLVTIPKAGHFVQQDAADLVTRSIAAWLRR